MLKTMLIAGLCGVVGSIVVNAVAGFHSDDWQWWVLCSPFWVIGVLINFLRVRSV